MPPDPMFLGTKPRNPKISAEDPWIRKHSLFISPRKVHAIGTLVLAWNGAERGLINLAGKLARLPEKAAWAIFHDGRDVKLSEKIKQLYEINGHTTILREPIWNILDVYEICRVNRNALVHNIGYLSRAGMELRKKTNHYMETQKIKQSIGHIRKTVDQINSLVKATNEVIHSVQICESAKQIMYDEKWILRNQDGVPIPLPAKLPLPELLVTPPRPQKTPKQRRQPRPSRA